VVISRCIELCACRWDGAKILSEPVRRLMPHVDLVPACPEVSIGLGVPREPVRVVQADGTRRLLQPATGVDLTPPMTTFVESFIQSLGAVDGFILKSRSPSCGLVDTKVYGDMNDRAPLRQAGGFFGAAVREQFAHLAVEDEERLADAASCRQFLTRLFALADLRGVEAQPTAGGLVALQARHKLLLMAYDPRQMRALGHVVARPAGETVTEALAAYAGGFRRVLARPPSAGAHVNVLMHAFGYLVLSHEQKAHYLALLEAYRVGEASLSRAIDTLYEWIAQQGIDYLVQQSYFAPFPVGICPDDEGRG
jgi:uncharacterized protein YbgA (DUF1722 family)/uncharacterized protein YbbK (DUF523 family)